MPRRADLTPQQVQNTKDAIIDCLQKSPFIESACKKVGIARSTYYEWIKADKEFAAAAEEAMQVSRATTNDIVESALLGKVTEGHFGSMKFYLEHNHSNYQKQKYCCRTRTCNECHDYEEKQKTRNGQVVYLDALMQRIDPPEE